MKYQTIKRWVVLALCGYGLHLPILAQKVALSSPSPASLPMGTYIKGVYTIQPDDGNNQYLKQQPNGTLTTEALQQTEAGFFFWVVQNVYTETFQVYSALEDAGGKPWAIQADGTTQWEQDAKAETAQLVFRMYTDGPVRTQAEADGGTVARAYITTSTLQNANNDCKCNVLKSGSNARFKVQEVDNSASPYIPIVFNKADQNASGIIGAVTGDSVRLSVPDNTTQNFVSSKFFVGGFGADDFEVTVLPNTEGYIGFVEYAYHGFQKQVYVDARPKIGIKVTVDDKDTQDVNDDETKIALEYLSGDQQLPNQPPLIMEKATNFVTNKPIKFGFADQYILSATQENVTVTMATPVPAEFFFNRSITNSARMLVRLTQGTVDLSYTPKNYLVNSTDDMGSNDDSKFVSTNAYFPYNRGNALMNTFNWQETEWPLKYQGNNGVVTDTVFSPFYQTRTEFAGISARFPNGTYAGGEDFSSAEGWELVKANLGHHANGNAQNNPPVHPYIVFYDWAAGILRVFVYTNNEGEANQLTVKLNSFGGTPNNKVNAYAPRLWGSLQQFASLDQVTNSAYSKAVPFYGGSGREWYFADFVMEYDPCIAFLESTLQLTVEKTTQGTLSMIGRLEGGVVPSGNEYTGWNAERENFLLGVMDNDFGQLANTLGDITFAQYEQFDLEDFNSTATGLLEGKKIADWQKEAARLSWEGTMGLGITTIAQGTMQMGIGVAQIVEGAAKMGETSVSPTGSVQGGAKIAQGGLMIGLGVATMSNGAARLMVADAKKMYWDNIKDKEREDPQNISLEMPPPRPQVVFGELALKGTLTISTTLIPADYIATPGGKNSENAPEWFANQSSGSAPLYNRPMGKFTLLNQPEFGVAVTQNQTYIKIKEKPYFAHNNYALGKIDDMLTLLIHVETLDTQGKSINSSTGGGGHTNLFGLAGSNPLPGKLDITGLVDWEQLQININTLGNNPSNADIKSALGNWIKVSYEVPSITLTNLKARNLDRAFARGTNYYTGNSIFAYSSTENANALVESEFPDSGGYNFSDRQDFGTDYSLYHSEYDNESGGFYAAMDAYCQTLGVPANANARTESTPEPEKEAEPVDMGQPGLAVYPNPTRDAFTFRLVSEVEGEVNIALYDLSGRMLIHTTEVLNGRDVLQGRVTISALNAGVYIIKATLPNGKSITERIVKAD